MSDRLDGLLDEPVQHPSPYLIKPEPAGHDSADLFMQSCRAAAAARGVEDPDSYVPKIDLTLPGGRTS